MKIWPECIPCFLKMSLEVVRTLTNDEKQIKRFMTEVMELRHLRGEDYLITSPEMVRNVWLKIKEFYGLEDPLKIKKEEQNHKALNLYPVAKEIIKKSNDPIVDAFKLAILGNSIDSMGDIKGFSIEGMVKLLQESWIDARAIEELQTKISKVRKIVYLGDNCGEIVFDKQCLSNVNMSP